MNMTSMNISLPEPLKLFVEEQVESLPAASNALVLPAWLISAASIVPGGAYPSYAHGYYERDNAFYLAWDEIARERTVFQGWMRQHVLEVADHAALLRKVGVAA